MKGHLDVKEHDLVRETNDKKTFNMNESQEQIARKSEGQTQTNNVVTAKKYSKLYTESSSDNQRSWTNSK